MIFFNKLLDADCTIVIEGEESAANFRELVQRATNLWPDAPAEIKAFADKVTCSWANGTPLQDYHSQDTSGKPKNCRHYNSIAMPKMGPGWLKCKDCGYERDVESPRDPRKENR